MELIFRVIILLLDILQVTILLDVFLGISFSKNWKAALFVVLTTICLYGYIFINPESVLYHNVEFISITLTIVLLGKGKLWVKCLSSFILFFIVSALETFIYYMLNGASDFSDKTLQICSSICSIILIIIVSVIYQRIIGKKLIIQNKIIAILSGVMVFVGALTAIFPILAEYDNIRNSKFEILFFILCFTVLLGSLCMLYYCGKSEEYSAKEIIYKEKEKLMIQYYNSVTENNAELHMFRHDYKNHIRSIRLLLQEKQYDKVNDYIAEMDNQLSILTSRLVLVGNDFVNAILNDYIHQSKECGINIIVQGKVPPDCSITDIDWSIILSNGINNAIEAVQKLIDQPKEINIDFSVIHNKIYLKILNGYCGNISISNGIIKTSKSDIYNHGFGIKNMLSIIKKYHGQLEYELLDGNMLATKIILIYESLDS